jgi:hypothetical protein
MVNRTLHLKNLHYVREDPNLRGLATDRYKRSSAFLTEINKVCVKGRVTAK